MKIKLYSKYENKTVLVLMSEPFSQLFNQ